MVMVHLKSVFLLLCLLPCISVSFSDYSHLAVVPLGFGCIVVVVWLIELFFGCCYTGNNAVCMCVLMWMYVFVCVHAFVCVCVCVSWMGGDPIRKYGIQYYKERKKLSLFSVYMLASF